jgi:hypothetical protein
VPTGIDAEFVEHMKRSGLLPSTIEYYSRMARAFLRHVGNRQIDRISEAETRAFFEGVKGEKNRRRYAIAVTQFLIFAAARLPVPVAGRQEQLPAVPGKLRQKWTAEKLLEQRETDKDLIAKLARKVIDHYQYFQSRIQGEPDNLDDIYRFADECKDLIQSNLPLFMGLSAQGRNVHSVIDERVQR